MANLLKEALTGIKGVEVKYDLSFRDLTTIKVGGPIGATAFVREVESLHRLMERLEEHSIPWLVLGKGSNLLASDRGFDGVVLILTGQMASFRRDGTKLVVGAGLGLKRLMGRLIRERISGLEFLVGIPGTVGGAVAVNAGAFGKEIKDVLTQVELLSPQGIKSVEPSQLDFRYRGCSLPPKSVIIGSSFLVEPSSPEKIKRNMQLYMRRRLESQPIRWPSMGSVFKNPPGDYAGRLIEISGLKGKRIGGAFVSEVHANFILNDGTATCAHIVDLIEYIKEKVREKTGVTLELEVRTIE